MIAAKFFEDQPCDNGYFATVGGVSVQEINTMEITFLSMLEYRVAVTGIEYNLYAQVMDAKADYLEKPRAHYLKEVNTPSNSFRFLYFEPLEQVANVFLQAITPDTSSTTLGLAKPIPASS